jgi:Heparinase II/III-like protein
MIIDPGTGAYYANGELRDWLASRRAHNGPCPVAEEWPRRLGPFLWSEHHPRPHLVMDGGGKTAALAIPGALPVRIVECADGNKVVVNDAINRNGPDFTVRWQFAPETQCETLELRRFRITRQGKTLEIHVSADWDGVELVEHREAAELEGIVSPHFRVTTWAPYLKLSASSRKPCLFTTTFLASSIP